MFDKMPILIEINHDLLDILLPMRSNNLYFMEVLDINLKTHHFTY